MSGQWGTVAVHAAGEAVRAATSIDSRSAIARAHDLGMSNREISRRVGLTLIEKQSKGAACAE